MGLNLLLLMAMVATNLLSLYHLSTTVPSPIPHPRPPPPPAPLGGGTGSFAATMKRDYNVTIVTTTINLGAPYSEVAAVRGVVLMHILLQRRLPVFDGTMDLVRCGRTVNRWILDVVLEFMLFDFDRVLRGSWYLWLDHFFSKGVSLEKLYKPLTGKLGYKKVKWAVVNKTDTAGIKNKEVYLTALLQKPMSR